jgi:hypothetical protein
VKLYAVAVLLLFVPIEQLNCYTRVRLSLLRRYISIKSIQRVHHEHSNDVVRGNKRQSRCFSMLNRGTLQSFEAQAQ